MKSLVRTPVSLHASPTRAKGREEEKKRRAKIGEWQRSIMMHCGGQARPIVRPAEGRRGGDEGEGRRPCPQLRTGYVKQPGRPAGRCVRLTCLPALLEDKRSWQGCLAPLNPSFSCPATSAFPRIESSVKPSHYVSPFFPPFNSTPFEASLLLPEFVLSNI